MSTDADNKACPSASVQCSAEDLPSTEEASTKKKPPRKVCFPDEEHIVTQYFEPANPWQDVPPTTRTQLAAEYLESCRRHNTPPIESVLEQIRELPDGVVGGGTRAARLTLAACSLLSAAPCDALETVFHRAQFRRVEIECADIDDEGAEALFDMIEYYESATVVALTGPRHFGIRGWQAASRMIKKSAELSELEVSDGPIEGAHAPVLARALRPHSCRLRSLSLQRAALAGDPLLCLVIALKCNRSVRELRVCDNRLTAADAAQLAALLKLNTRIQLLDLSNNQIQDTGVGHLAEALVEQAAQTPPSPTGSPMSPHQCPMAGGFESRGLAYLVLWNNQLTRNCVHNLTKMVRATKSLCVLNVGRNAIGSAAVRVLGAGALLSLGLQGVRLAPDAAPLLQAALAADTHLQRIDLRDNRLGAEGLQAILAALDTNKTLTQVDLDEPAESSSQLGADGAAAARLAREVRAACARNEPAAAPQRRVHRKISLTCHTSHTSCLQRVSHHSHSRRGHYRTRARCARNEPAAAPQRRVHRKISLTCHTSHTSCLQRVSHHSHSRRGHYRTRARCARNEPAAAPQRRVHRKISLTCHTSHTSCLQRVSHHSHSRRGHYRTRARCARNEPAAAPQRRVHRKISLTCHTSHTSCLQRVSHHSHSRRGHYRTRARCARNEPAAAPQRRVHRKISLTCHTSHTSCLQRVSHHSHSRRGHYRTRARCARNEPAAAPQRRVHRKISLTCHTSHTSCLQRVSHHSHSRRGHYRTRARCARNEPAAAPQRRVHRKISLTCHTSHTSCLQRVSHHSHSRRGHYRTRARCARNEPAAAPQRRVHRKISLTCHTSHTSCLQRVSHHSHSRRGHYRTRARCARNEPAAAPQRRVHRKISLTCHTSHTSCLQRVSHHSHSRRGHYRTRARCARNEPAAAPQRRVHRKISLTCHTSHTSCLQRVSHHSHSRRGHYRTRARCARNEPAAAPQRRVHRKISLTCHTSHTSCLQRVSHHSHSRRGHYRTRARCARNEPAAAPQRRVHRKISLTCHTSHTSCLQRVSHHSHSRRGHYRTRARCARNEPAAAPQRRVHRKISLTCHTSHTSCLQRVSHHSHSRRGHYRTRARCARNEPAAAPQRRVHRKISLTCHTSHTSCLQRVSHHSHSRRGHYRTRARCARNEPAAAPQRRVHRKISLTCHTSHTSCLQRVSHHSHSRRGHYRTRARCARNEPAAAPQRRVHRKISLTCHTSHTSCLQRVSHHSHSRRGHYRTRARCARNEPAAAPQRRVHRKISLTCHTSHTSCLQRVSHHSHSRRGHYRTRARCARNEPAAAPQRRVHRKISLTCHTSHTSCLQRVSHHSHSRRGHYRTRARCARNEPAAAPQRRVHRKISLTCHTSHTSCLQRVSHHSHSRRGHYRTRARCARNEPAAAPQRRVHRKISLTCHTSHTSCLQRVSHHSHSRRGHYRTRARCARNEPAAAPQRRVHRKISLTCHTSHTSCLQRVSHHSHSRRGHYRTRARCARNEPAAAPQRRVHRKISLTCHTSHTSCLQRVSHHSHSRRGHYRTRARCARNEPAAAPQRRVHRKISLTCHTSHTSCLQRVSHHSHSRRGHYRTRARCARNEPAAAPQRRVHRKISLTCHTSHTSCLQRVSHHSHSRRGHYRTRARCARNEPAAAPQRRVHRKISLTCHTSHTSCLQRVSHHSHSRRGHYRTRARCARNEPAAAPQRRVHRKISLTCHTSHTSCLQRGLQAEEERRGGRLRSPAPSPAGSPVPSAHPSRFSVTRVTPDRAPTPELSSPSGLRAGYNAPSRFKVVQVAEPPQIQVQSATPDQPQRSASRFSVTRNLDTMYDPGFVPSPPPTPMPTKSRPSAALEDQRRPCAATTPQDKPKDCASAPVAFPKPDVNKEKSDELEKTSVKLSEDVNSAAVSDKDCVNKEEDVFRDRSEALSHDEAVSVIGDNIITKTETKLVKSSKAVRENEKIDVQVSVVVKKESVEDAKRGDRIDDNFRNIDESVVEKRDDVAFKKIEALTENLGSIIEEMRDRSKTVKAVKVSDCTQTDVNIDSKLDTFDVVPVINRDNVVLKKNKSESSLDSPDLEVSRLMNKKLVCSPFFDSSSSLEISGSSMESLNALDNQTAKPIIVQESVESDSELDRRKSDVVLSTESSIESTSEVTPVNSGNFLNMSVSSNESVSPIIFGKNKKIHGSISSLEASVSSLESKHEKVMLTSADSGIEYSLQNPTENKEDNSSNEGTLTNNSSLKETVKTDNFQIQETLTCSPKRTSSLLDVPALKTKGLDRMRKISWVAPSASFHIPRPEPEKESKLPGHLEKLLSIFQHPSSIFSRSCEDEKKSNSNTPPRKDSSLTSSFWAWGSGTERSEDREDRDSLSEATDSTLSERVQVSFVDESFSKKLDSKTPSTDTDNTLSEFQSFPQGNSETSEAEPDKFKVTDNTTDDNLVQKCIGLSMNDASANGNRNVAKACDTVDLNKPNDLNKNYDMKTTSESIKNPASEAKTDVKEEKTEPVIPRSFAAVLKASSTENSLEKQSPETGQSVDKLPSKVIRDIKENISPENTLTSSMTKALALEVTEKQIKNQPIVNALWEVTLDNEIKKDEVKSQTDLAPIATIEETCDETFETAQLDFIDDIKFIDEKNASGDSGVTLESTAEVKVATELEHVDLGKDALSYLIYENQDFEPGVETSVKTQVEPGSLAQELREAEIKEQLLDLSPELVVDAAEEVPEVFSKEAVGVTSPIIPERAKLKKSSSMEDFLNQVDQKRTIAFKVPVVSTPRDIPERRSKLRSKSGTSPKSLPESLNKPSPLSKMDPISKKKKKVSSLGKIARDSLLALNMSEEEMAEFRRSYKLTSVESLRSLESVSEDANSQSNSVDSRCRSCLRTSQESLMSCDSFNEECRCVDSDRPSHSGR